MALTIEQLKTKPTKSEIKKMPFAEMVERKTFAYEVAVASGTNAERLLSGLYKDPTHFIYELLQNAEDTEATEVKMTLERDRLIFEHNGRYFNNRDTWAILSIDESPKNDNDGEELTQIGRFGIGFKSVFGICNAPEIYSRDFCFQIRNFYVPEQIIRPSGQDPNRTYIILKFKADEADDIFDTIEEALSTLNPDTILFLRNIIKLDYMTPEHNGFFEKKKPKRKKDGHEYYECDILGRQGLLAKYYLFERPLTKKNKLFSSIAFRVDEEKKSIIAEEESTKLVVFFPTETNTFLSFKVNGAYQTTPTRESVPETADNLEILKETAELYAESLKCIKALGLMTVDFLQTLPLKTRRKTEWRMVNGQYQQITKTDSIYYEAFYDATVKALLTEEFLPTLEGKFTTADKALLARGGATESRGESIVKLLTATENAQVFGDRTVWLSTAITQNNTRELWAFITTVLKITEVDYDEFLGTVTGEFLEKQPEDWLVRFYIAIGNRIIDTVRTKHLNKPIIKTENGTMVAPQVKGKPNIYLASKLIADKDKIVHSGLCRNPEVKKFFEGIGIEEMDIVESIRTQWLPSITESRAESDNADSLELLYLEYLDQKPTVQTELCELLRASDCVLYFSHNDNTGADDAYYGKPTGFYMAHGASKILYDGCPRVRFINDILDKKAQAEKGFFDFLREIGVRAGATIYKTTNPLPWDDEERKRITKNTNAAYGNYYYESWQISEIDYILANMNKERARTLWQYVSNIHEERFKGYISWSLRNTSYREPFTAHFVRSLQAGAWLYKSGSNDPVTPKEIYQEDAEREYGRAPVITKHFTFMPDAARQLPPDDYDLLVLAQRIKASGGEAELRKLAELCAAIPEVPIVIDVKPENTPVAISEAMFNNPYEGKTSDELTQDGENSEVASALTGVIEGLYGNADIPETVKEHIAIKLANNEAELDGDLGERFVISSLKEEYRQAGYIITNDTADTFSATKDGRTIDIMRHNSQTRNQRGYDITIAERGVVLEWIEVKAKKDDNPKLFKVSGLQWATAKAKYDEGDGDKYWVYVVTFVREPKKTKITKTPNPYKAWLESKIKANPVRIEY